MRTEFLENVHEFPLLFHVVFRPMIEAIKKNPCSVQSDFFFLLLVLHQWKAVRSRNVYECK